jgi:hypothetical protein
MNTKLLPRVKKMLIHIEIDLFSWVFVWQDGTGNNLVGQACLGPLRTLL